MASTSSSARRVICNTNYAFRRGRRSGPLSCNVQFRLPGGVYHVLKENVPNVSLFLRKLVYDALKHLPLEERDRLEVDVIELIDELRRVHNYQSSLLKHGSYAKNYLERLKGGRVVDTKPYYQRDPPPEVSKDELKTVEQVIQYRELLASRLNQKLRCLVELKKASFEGGETSE